MEKKNTGIHSIYVGNLNYNTDEDQLLGLFKSFGYIKNIKIMREGKANKHKGIAFVDMVNLADAEKAIKAIDGKLNYGRTLKVSLATTQNFKPEIHPESLTSAKNPKKLRDNIAKK
ncbi:MAG: RNA-binding protein, partial [Halobacteriovoraceae bacterium]|nr:RNA-binding protein [Halobacteriovoraceae bacterium]